MAIPTTGATVTTAVNGGGGSSSPLTGSHTTDTNTNLLIVIVTYGYLATLHATSVTFDGNALTELDSVVNGNNARCDIWYLKNPGVKTATVSVGSFGGTARLGWTAINVIGAEVSGTTFGTHSAATFSDTNMVTSLSSATDELCLAGAAIRTFSDGLNVQAPLTEVSRFAHSVQGSFCTGQRAGEASADIGFTAGSAAQGVILTVPIKPSVTAAALSIYGWRLRDDTGIEGSGGGGFLANEDTAIQASPSGTSVDVALDANVRVRLGLDEDNTADPATGAIQVRAKVNGGAAFDVTTSSTLVKMSLSSQFVDDAVTTDHGLAAPAGTFVAGAILEIDGLSPSINLAQNGYTIIEACVQLLSAGLVPGDAIVFGLRLNGIDYFAGTTMITVRAAEPTTVAAGTPGDTTVPLTWADPNATDLPVRVYYKKTADAEWVPEGALPAGTTAHTFGNLIPLVVSTAYDFGVSAWNDPYESIIVTDSATTTSASTARAAHITAFELETGDIGTLRKAHITAFELETTDAVREAHITAFEMEAEDAPRKAHVTAFELRTYNAAQGDPVASLGKLGLGLSPMGLGI